jgi:hypothetical protein
VVRAWKFNVRDLPNGCIAEPRELLERQKQFALAHQSEPEIGRDLYQFGMTAVGEPIWKIIAGFSRRDGVS